MPADLKDPQYWRGRAERVLSMAEHFDREESKIILRRIADDYQHIAILIERQREREKT